MTARRRTSIAVAALAAPLAFPSLHGSASADQFIGHVVGTGTVAPGFPLWPRCTAPQDVAFSGTMTVNSGSHAGSYDFAFTGTLDRCSSLLVTGDSLVGLGSGTFSGDISGNLLISWTGGAALSGAGQVLIGVTMAIATMDCVTPPTSLNPTSTFTFSCVMRGLH